MLFRSGPAGVSAAISAGRAGAKTMLIEQLAEVGGVATSGLMSHWTGKTQGGLYEEILDRTAKTYHKDDKNHMERMTINHEHLKLELIKMLEEANVAIRMYTFVSDAIREGDTLKGVVVESKSGREAIMASVVIDCTGDGDLAAKAGARFIKGRELDGKMQPMTLMFQVAGVDLEQVTYVEGFEDTYAVPEGDVQTLARKYITSPAGHVLIYPSEIGRAHV